MSADVLLYVLIGVALVSAVSSQRLVGGKQATGPTGALVLTNLCRLLLVAGWVWFGFLTGYWQIAVIVLATAVVGYAGILARNAAS